jgi:hypothetical protein
MVLFHKMRDEKNSAILSELEAYKIQIVTFFHTIRN